MLADLQKQFATSCRTGECKSFAGIEERRIEIYRNAVFSGVRRVLEKAYPLTKAALGDEWEQLISEFFANHDCPSPHLWKMPRELYAYVEKRGSEIPWLIELLYFEWIEIEVHMGPDISVECQDDGDILSDPLVMNPEHRLTRFTYPVFREKTEHLRPGAHFLFTYRHPGICDVRFLELSPLLAVAIASLAIHPMPVPEVVELSCDQLGLSFDEKICENVLEFFENMLAQGAALGFTSRGDHSCDS
jgi:uncharacterized protein